MADTLYPMRLAPVLHPRVWGGTRLRDVLGKAVPPGQPYGESWEMHDTARIENGPFAGQMVREVLDVLGHWLVGERFDPANGMPLLLKFLDAGDWLSVQVHPDDAQAAALEGQPRGKTEAWIVLQADAGAQLISGLQEGTTPAMLREAVASHHLPDLLVRTPVQAGDVLFVSAGTVHALGPGLLIYEIQQSSDTTYRFYDWDRPGIDGRPRELHIDRSLAVSQMGTMPVRRGLFDERGAEVVLLSTPFFDTILHRLGGSYPNEAHAETGGRFQIVTVIEGRAEILGSGEAVLLEHGQTALIPAAQGAFRLRTGQPNTVLLRSQPGTG